MIRLIFGIHNHQPVGNFDHVFEEAYKKCYKPFLDTIGNHPALKFSFHTSGPLYQWLEKNHPEWFELVAKSIEAGQMEILGGGFYEPILSAIPYEDKLGQIGMMKNYIKEKFGSEPQGMWTAERVWEPSLPRVMAESGVNFTVLDDTHFRWAGLKNDELLGYYITEEEGLPVYVFPINKFLRYSIPFKKPQVTIDYLKKIYDERGDVVIVYADDGEKFGLWPGTYKTCYSNKWLSRFFHLLSKNLGWIKPVFFSEALNEIPPVGRAYLPTSSYAEMGQWALPADGYNDYERLENKLEDEKLSEQYGYLVKGGFWRNFMTKYAEANNMHKRMLYLTYKIREAAEEKEIDQESLGKAIDLKWQGQCNCPYWHGVFGGLYLNHLRHATYSRFISADKILESKKKKPFIDYDVYDFDFDGKDEVILKNQYINLYMAPFYGGSIFELDYKPASINLIDTMTRYKEGYHKKLADADKSESAGGSIHDRVEAKEKGLEDALVYDWHRRLGFLDHFFDNNLTPEQFARNDYNELGDFVDQPFTAALDQNENRFTLDMQREGHIWVDKIWASVRLLKRITLNAETSGFTVEYRIINGSDAHLKCRYGIETAWSLLAGDSPDRYYHIDGKKLDRPNMNSTGISLNSEVINMRDEALGYDIGLKCDNTVDWWRFPIETISLSEGGFEKNYQGSIVMAVIDIDIKPGEIFEHSIIVTISQLD
jgi:alpha-amylase/alpha-mannosidase (GH57 family)